MYKHDHSVCITALFDDTPTPTPEPPMATPSALPDFAALKPADALTLMRGPVMANSVATEAQVVAIMTAWGTGGLAAADRAKFTLSFVMACVDQGSSAQVLLVGAANGLEFAQAARAVKVVCTLRQFCMFYAKIAFDAMVRAQRAPANWQRLGYPFGARYAAFDFFNGVSHGAAQEPPHGLIREPSEDERNAANANSTLAIVNSRSRNVTSNGQVLVQQQGVQGFQRPAIGWP